MQVVIVGGGIGGLATALSLHAVGIGCTVFEQTRELRELGVGITVLPHAIKHLAALGLLGELDRAGIRTRELIYANRFGQVVWRDLRGIEAGLDTPQFSIHRGKLHGVLLAAVRQRLGVDAVRAGCRLESFVERGGRVTAQFAQRDDDTSIAAEGDVLIGADGIHSAVRRIFYPGEGAPRWNGTMLWRGAADWPVYVDGRTMVIAGGMTAKFVFYPIHADPAAPDRRLTNWAVMARIADPGAAPRREDWNRPGRLDDVAPLVREKFRFDFVDPLALIRATDGFFEYPLCDRDPLPRWSFGHATLLGDAAHPMYPVGSNGGSQAVLDAHALARHLASAGASPAAALAAYEAERRPMTTEIVLANRKGGPEGVIDLLETRAPDGFTDVEAVASHAEREAIVRGYATMAGFAREQMRRR